MSRGIIATAVGLMLLVTVLVGCGGLGFAVRAGIAPEVMVRLPPDMRYQLIVRVGADALPWDQRRRRETAINVWVHGTNTDWHIVRLLYVPLGASVQQEE